MSSCLYLCCRLFLFFPSSPSLLPTLSLSLALYLTSLRALLPPPRSSSPQHHRPPSLLPTFLPSPVSLSSTLQMLVNIHIHTHTHTRRRAAGRRGASTPTQIKVRCYRCRWDQTPVEELRLEKGFHRGSDVTQPPSLHGDLPFRHLLLLLFVLLLHLLLSAASSLQEITSYM